MWYCNNCKSEFKEPKRIITTYETFFGVSSMFPDSNRLELLVCPNCDDDATDIEEMRECDQCGEWTRECDLEDTDGCVNGGIGYLCPQCIEDCEVIL